MANDKHGFIDWAGTHRNFADEADSALRDVVKAATEFGKEASLTITLKVKPNNENQLTHAVDIKTKLPRKGVPPAIFFSDEDGGLHRADPRQRDIEDEDAIRSISSLARSGPAHKKPN